MGFGSHVWVPLHVDWLRCWQVRHGYSIPTHFLSMFMRVLRHPGGLAVVEYLSCKPVQWPCMVRLLGLALQRAAWQWVSVECVIHVCGETFVAGDLGEATAHNGGQGPIRI